LQNKKTLNWFIEARFCIFTENKFVVCGQENGRLFIEAED
jgi:hypothetical protein